MNNSHYLFYPLLKTGPHKDHNKKKTTIAGIMNIKLNKTEPDII